jgi:hypothetical protein
MSQVMSRAEIEAQFPDEWVLVVNPETGPDQRIRSGVVAAHSKDRSEVHRMALETRARHIAIWFNGDPIPAGMKVLL